MKKRYTLLLNKVHKIISLVSTQTTVCPFCRSQILQKHEETARRLLGSVIMPSGEYDRISRLMGNGSKYATQGEFGASHYEWATAAKRIAIQKALHA